MKCVAMSDRDFTILYSRVRDAKASSKGVMCEIWISLTLVPCNALLYNTILCNTLQYITVLKRNSGLLFS